VCFTILVLPVLLDEEYWSFQYCVFYNTSGITSIFQNLPVSAILVLPVFSRIFQYLQYWYYQYFPESSNICNTGITSIFRRDTGITILVHNTGNTSILPVSSSICNTGTDTGKY
jgi:hypothetical protein